MSQRPKRFVGLKTKNSNNALTSQRKKKAGMIGIPKDIIENEELNKIIKISLPENYNFEIHKTLWRIRIYKAKRVGLQFPEGLVRYSCVISKILEKFGSVETVIMADVVYGSCCIDDFTARALQIDFLVHYGHSCLIPIDKCFIPIFYALVDIKIDTEHFIQTIKANFNKDSKLAFLSTIQFASSVQAAKNILVSKDGFENIIIPHVPPLAPSEVLGCTAPKIPDGFIPLFLADGRFHIEAVMLMNPKIEKMFQYNPYSKILSIERFDNLSVLNSRRNAIKKAKKAKKKR
eukprot:Anaeramoba_ignava/a354268_6.p1 GENE.a354268_6~~a354268_6.p1  ORF type:complete len:290 (+),score=75.98 a354268_6:1-870(+)